MAVINGSIPKIPTSEYMIGDGPNHVVEANWQEWSDGRDIAWWLARLLEAQPEVHQVVYVQDWGQGEPNVQLFLTDGTPVFIQIGAGFD